MDARTGLPDDRESDTWLVERAARGTPLVVAVLDVDRFREFNDHRGHLAGDGLLRSLADLLRESAEADALAGRFGSDEFLLAWPHHDTTTAVEEIEQLRRRFHEQTGLTVSAGVARLGRVGAESAANASRSLIAAADQALSDAKRSGGDCLRVSRT